MRYHGLGYENVTLQVSTNINTLSTVNVICVSVILSENERYRQLTTYFF